MSNDFRSKEIIKVLVEDSKGDYLVGLPDLNSVSNALSLMRDSSNLCMDMVLQPEELMDNIVKWSKKL